MSAPESTRRGRSLTIPRGRLWWLPESTPPSQDLPLLLWSCEVYSAPTIYPSLPEYTPLFNNYMRPSQNIYFPPRIYPFSTNACATLPSQNIHPPPPPEYIPFSTTIILCDPPRIYPSVPESTHLFNQFMCATLPVCDVRCPCLWRRSLYPLSLQVGLDTPLHNNGKNDVYTTLYKCCWAKRRLDIRRTITHSFELLQARTHDIELDNKSQ